MIITDPPYQFCDAQVENFKTQQAGHLYPDPEDFKEETSRVKHYNSLCKEEGRPGSCYEYFFVLKKLLKDLELLSSECKEKIFFRKRLKRGLIPGLDLDDGFGF